MTNTENIPTITCREYIMWQNFVWYPGRTNSIHQGMFRRQWIETHGKKDLFSVGLWNLESEEGRDERSSAGGELLSSSPPSDGQGDLWSPCPSSRPSDRREPLRGSLPEEDFGQTPSNAIATARDSSLLVQFKNSKWVFIGFLFDPPPKPWVVR